MPKQTFYNLPEEKREFIVQAAVDEFAEKGYKAASVSSIVSAAKIAKGSFYQYFEDKDDLYSYLFSTMIAQRKHAVFVSEQHRLEELSLTGFLRIVLQRLLDEFNRNPKIVRIGMDFIRLGGEPIHQKLTDHFKPMLETYFVPFIQHEIDQGEINPAINVSMLNFMLTSLGQYITTQYQETGDRNITPASVDKLCDDLEYILTNGIYGK